jgi:hypothetical protein
MDLGARREGALALPTGTGRAEEIYAWQAP